MPGPETSYFPAFAFIDLLAGFGGMRRGFEPVCGHCADPLPTGRRTWRCCDLGPALPREPEATMRQTHRFPAL